MHASPVAPAPARRLMLLGAAMECGFVAMLLASPRPGRTLAYLAWFFAVFGCYVLAVRLVLRGTSGAGRIVVVLACLFRVTFVFAAPTLSDDVQRYLWDGRVTLRGGNPYAATPASMAATLPDTRAAAFDHAEVPTIYPPVAQLVFAAGAAVGPGVLGIKLVVVLLDLLVIAVLGALLRERGLAGSRVLIYAWNPLVVTEAAWSGHIEPAGTLAVLLAAAWIIQKRDARATLALAVGGLVKILPLVLIAPLVRTVRARWLAIVPLVMLLAFWPFRSAGRLLFSGLREYADRWLANESLFAVVHALIVWIDPTPALKAAIAAVRRHVPHTASLDPLYGYVYPIDLAKGVCALALLGFAVWLVRRDTEPLRGMFWMTAAVLLLSPTAHPWYFLWVLPWLCLFPSPPWILLSGLVALAYANLGTPGRPAEPYPWIRLVEYVPFYALAGAGWLKARVAAGDAGRWRWSVRLAVVIAALLGVGALHAAPPQAASGTPAPPAVAPGTPASPPDTRQVLAIDPAASELTFTISRPGETIDGSAREFAGEVALDPGHLSAGSSVVLRVKAASLMTGNRLRDHKMRGTHLEVDRFPEIVFRSASIQVGEETTGPGTRKALVEGSLGLHGVERDIVVPAAIRYDNGTLTAEGSVDLTYSDYGIPIPRFLWLVMDDAVKVRFRFVARRSPG